MEILWGFKKKQINKDKRLFGKDFKKIQEILNKLVKVQTSQINF